MTIGRLGWPSVSMYSSLKRSGSIVRSAWIVASCLGRVPLRLGPELLCGTSGQPERGLEVEGLVPLANELDQRGDLVLELLRPVVDVSVVLGELPHADQSRQRP